MAIRSYFDNVTIFYKDELSLHLFLTTEMLFLGEETRFITLIKVKKNKNGGNGGCVKF